MRRVDGDGRQDGEHVGEEQPLQPAALAGLQVARLEDVHAGRAISAFSVRQHDCLSATRPEAKRLMVRSCWAGDSPSCD